MKRDELIQVMALVATPGLGSRRILELLRLFKSPASVVAAPAREVAAALGQAKSPAIGRALRDTYQRRDKLEKLLDDAEKIGVTVITYWDDDYPERLKKIPNPPIILYKKGLYSPLFNYAVAIVGTRAMSDYGGRMAFNFGRGLAAAGVTVVSGMALGVDGKAHEGAIAAGGRTIAVLGCGLDIIYPPKHRQLFEQILAHGAAISENPPGTSPEAFNFPQRNRIISGLSLGVVIIEAGLKSGALITARHALEQGREVFALPGQAGTMRSAGVNRLIKDGGAQMVESPEDVLEALKSQLAPVTNIAATLALPDMSGQEAALYKLLEDGSLLVDDLITRSGLGAVDVNRLLTAMQLKGVIRRIPGGRVGRA